MHPHPHVISMFSARLTSIRHVAPSIFVHPHSYVISDFLFFPSPSLISLGLTFSGLLPFRIPKLSITRSYSWLCSNSLIPRSPSSYVPRLVPFPRFLGTLVSRIPWLWFFPEFSAFHIQTFECPKFELWSLVFDPIFSPLLVGITNHHRIY